MVFRNRSSDELITVIFLEPICHCNEEANQAQLFAFLGLEKADF